MQFVCCFVLIHRCHSSQSHTPLLVGWYLQHGVTHKSTRATCRCKPLDAHSTSHENRRLSWCIQQVEAMKYFQETWYILYDVYMCKKTHHICILYTNNDTLHCSPGLFALVLVWEYHWRPSQWCWHRTTWLRKHCHVTVFWKTFVLALKSMLRKWNHLEQNKPESIKSIASNFHNVRHYSHIGNTQHRWPTHNFETSLAWSSFRSGATTVGPASEKRPLVSWDFGWTNTPWSLT